LVLSKDFGGPALKNETLYGLKDMKLQCFDSHDSWFQEGSADVTPKGEAVTTVPGLKGRAQADDL
jgi:hypothetical protein